MDSYSTLEVDGNAVGGLTCTTSAAFSSQPYLLVYNPKNTGTKRILNFGTSNIVASTFKLIGGSTYFRNAAITVGANQADLNYTVYNLTWSGGASSIWKVGGSDANFTGSDTVQRAGDNVTFDDSSSSGSRNIQLVSGDPVELTDVGYYPIDQYYENVSFNYTNAGNLIFNNTVAYSIYTEDSTAIAGPGSITKNGSGTLTMTESLQNNYFTGGFNLNAGTVISEFRTALGKGDLNLSGGTLQVSDALSLNGTVLYLTGNFNWTNGTLSVQ